MEVTLVFRRRQPFFWAAPTMPPGRPMGVRARTHHYESG